MTIVGPSEAILIAPLEGATYGIDIIGPEAITLAAPQERIIVGPGARPIHVGPVEPIVIERSRTVVTAAPGRIVTIEPPQRGAWDEKGWVLTKKGERRIYDGQYEVVQRRVGLRRQFPGRVAVSANETIAYIAGPPAEIKHHPKGPCFMRFNDTWFRVNWHRAAKNVDDAILYVEKVLDEAINRN